MFAINAVALIRYSKSICYLKVRIVIIGVNYWELLKDLLALSLLEMNYRFWRKESCKLQGKRENHSYQASFVILRLLSCRRLLILKLSGLILSA